MEKNIFGFPLKAANEMMIALAKHRGARITVVDDKSGALMLDAYQTEDGSITITRIGEHPKKESTPLPPHP